VLSHLPGLRNGDTSLQQSARVPAIGLDLALRLKKLNLPRKTSRYGFCLTPERQLPRYSVSAVAAVEQMAPSVPSMKADMMAKTGALLLVAAVVGLALAAGWLYGTSPENRSMPWYQAGANLAADLQNDQSQHQPRVNTNGERSCAYS
jgi:hypothetical protein